MTADLPLPPSGRDFEIYRRVTVQRMSTRDAAAEARISQTRVCQIVKRVGDFLAEVAPASEAEEGRPQRIYVAEQVAAERVDFMYGQAVEGWRDSKGTVTTVREVEAPAPSPAKVRITKNSAGDCRYLLAGARLAVIGSKLPFSTLGAGIETEATEDEADIGPPVRDCSAESDFVEECGRAATVSCNGTGVQDKGYSDEDFAAEETWQDVQRSVQRPMEVALPVPKQRAERPLNRHERRQRERLREKKLKQLRSA